MNVKRFTPLFLILIWGTVPLPSKALTLNPGVLPTSFIPADTNNYKIISRGGDAGDYQAFPDAVKLQNGDILVVFYAGDGHITYPNDNYPKAGRICMVRSTDDGKTWSSPVTIYDDIHDNRDSHISQLRDGTIMVSFFSLNLKSNPKSRSGVGVQFITSRDNGNTWSKEARLVTAVGKDWYCSAPIREMSDGTLIFPVYRQIMGTKNAWGGVLLSYDKGKSWTDPITIGENAGLFLAAETDVIRLRDGSLFAALRGQDDLPMHYSISQDVGKTWSPVKSIGFLAHSPHLNRLSTGEILMVYRGVEGSPSFSWDHAYTALRISYDESLSWQGPYKLDSSRGAYPSTVELDDGSILLVFYEEGANSGVGVLRFEMPSFAESFSPPARPVKYLKN